MRYRLILIILLGLTSTTFAQPNTVDRKIFDLLGLSLKSDLSIIQQDREQVLAKLREIAEGRIKNIAGTSVDSIDADIVLVRLDDGPTIDRLISEYRSYDKPRAIVEIPKTFERAKQASVIPGLAEDLFLDEDPTGGIRLSEPGGRMAITASNRSNRSGKLMIRIMQTSDAFTPEQQKWAKDMERWSIGRAKEFRDFMRIWWEQNKEAFLKKDYKAVKLMSPTAEPTQTPVLPVQPEPPVSTTPEPTPSPIPTPVVATSQEESSSWLFIVSCAVLTIMAGAGLFWLLKKPSSS